MKVRTYLLFVAGLGLIVLYGMFDPAQYAFPVCPFRSLTGWMCPGCGSQRAIHQALHGHFMESVRLNGLFIPAVIYAITGLVVSTALPDYWPEVRRKFFGLYAAYAALVIIIVFWLSRNLI